MPRARQRSPHDSCRYPRGHTISFQAVIQRGPGGGLSVKTNAITAKVGSTRPNVSNNPSTNAVQWQNYAILILPAMPVTSYQQASQALGKPLDRGSVVRASADSKKS